MNQRLWGADPDELERTARELGAAAAHIDRLLKTLSSQLAHAPWHGSRADRFRADWARSHRVQLLSSAAFLREGEQRLRSNAAAQRQASAIGAGAVGGPSGAPGGSGGMRDLLVAAWGGTLTAQQAWSWMAGPVGLLALSTTGRYTNTWNRVIDTLGPFARYKSSPLLTFLNQQPTYRSLHGLAQEVDSNKLFGAVGTAASIVGVVDHGSKGLDAALHGRTGDALNETSDLVSGGLKSSKNPVTYLIGVNVAIWSDVVEEATKVHWSEGLPDPTKDGNFTTMYVPVFTDAVRQVGGRMFGWLT